MMNENKGFKKNIVQQVEQLQIDENGELKSSLKSTIVSVGAEPDYVKLYLQDILYLKNLQSNQSALLYELLTYLNYNNEIMLNSVAKQRIADKLGTTRQVIDNNLGKYVKANILERIGRGTFRANPYLFGKGSWKDISELRSKNIHLAINYTAEGGRDLEVKISDKGEENEQGTNQTSKTSQSA